MLNNFSRKLKIAFISDYCSYFIKASGDIAVPGGNLPVTLISWRVEENASIFELWIC